MPTLDLRNIARMPVKILVNETWNFLLTVVGASTLTGATATMIIRTSLNSGTLQTLTVGAGLTITAADKIAISPAIIATEGEYFYELEVTAVDGSVFRIKDKIYCTYE